MEKTGSINKRITDNAVLLNRGRNLLHIEGKAEQGRIFFASGVSGAMQAFKEAPVFNEPKPIIQAEQFYLFQELEYTDKKDKLRLSSLNHAITSFDDALKALSTLESPREYKSVEKSYPNTDKYRVKGLPKDAFHIACSSHKTRLMNDLKGALSSSEKELIKQRITNLDTAKILYTEKQRLALGLPENAKIKTNDRER
jgi:hypothetical protein